jgi:ABC-type multidrug transport system fused ATPase/permease subunit
LNQIILVLFGVFFVGSVFAFIRATLFTVAGERVVARMRRMLFASVLQQEIAFFDEIVCWLGLGLGLELLELLVVLTFVLVTQRTGELTNRLASDTMVLQNTVTVNISMGLRYVAQAMGGLLLLFYISWKLTLVMLSCVPIVAIGAVMYGLYVRRLAKDRQDALARASEVAEEAFSNIRTVRTFSKEDYESERYDARVQDSYELGKKLGIAFGGFAGGIAFIAQVCCRQSPTQQQQQQQQQW